MNGTAGIRNQVMTAVGEENTRASLKVGAVETLFLSGSLTKPLIKDLTKLAQNIGSKVKMISRETEEGE